MLAASELLAFASRVAHAGDAGMVCGRTDTAEPKAPDLRSDAPANGGQTATGRPFFVSPSGRDSWSGYLAAPAADGSDGPFATIGQARDAVRQLRKTQSQAAEVTIYIRAGKYRLGEPIVFTAEDFGIRILPFAGERPELAGSAAVTHWLRNSDGRFSSALTVDPGEEAFVGGVRQTLASKPGAIGGWRNTAPSPSVNSFSFHDAEIDTGDQTPGLKVELFDNTGAFNTRTRITQVDFVSHIATVAPSDRGPVSNIGSFRLIGNARWVNGKGSFAWDAGKHKVFVVPTDPAALVRDGLQVPMLRSLIILRGSHDITVAGLKFEETATAPAGELESAAIVLEGAKGNAVSGNRFENVGQAIRLTGSSGNLIERNVLIDTGSTGIELQDNSNRNSISGNILKRTGRVEKSSAAIYLHGASGNNISLNTVSNVPRHGIGIDNWDNTTINAANIVEFNKIWDTNQETYDTGAIEMLGRSGIDTNSVIRYNDIRNAGVASSARNAHRNTAASGIYLDDLTSGVLVCGNRISGAPLAAIQIHGGSNIVVRDNLAVLDRPESVFAFLQSAPRASAAERFSFVWRLPATEPSEADQKNSPVKSNGPAGKHHLDIRFDNDATIGDEDRDLFVGKVQIGTRTLAPEDAAARYVTDDGRSFPGQTSLPWNGTLIWDLSDLKLDGAGEVPISVFAWSNPAAGIGAHFKVSIDGLQVGEGTADPLPDTMTGNVITKNIIYATARGSSYFKTLQGGTPLVSNNDYADSTATRRIDAMAWPDTNPISIDPGLVALSAGDLLLSLPRDLKAAGFSDPPICTAKIVRCSERTTANGELH